MNWARWPAPALITLLLAARAQAQEPVPAPPEPAPPPAVSPPAPAPPPPAPPPPYPYPYAYPYPYRPPPPVAPPAPPPPKDDRPQMIAPWDPEDPPPDGYLLRSKVNAGAVAAGSTLLGVAWLTSIFTGAILAEEEDEEGIDGDGVEGEDFAGMYVPIVGPFITIETVEAKRAGLGLLLADGVLQVGGAGLLVLGIVDREYRVVRAPVAELEIAPLVAGDAHGLALRGRY